MLENLVRPSVVGLAVDFGEWGIKLLDDGLEAVVDNTFDSVSWYPLPAETSRSGWLADTGSGTQIDWYNRKARSQEQLDALIATEVTPAAASRIRLQVQEALEREPQ